MNCCSVNPVGWALWTWTSVSLLSGHGYHREHRAGENPKVRTWRKILHLCIISDVFLTLNSGGSYSTSNQITCRRVSCLRMAHAFVLPPQWISVHAYASISWRKSVSRMKHFTFFTVYNDHSKSNFWLDEHKRSYQIAMLNCRICCFTK